MNDYALSLGLRVEKNRVVVSSRDVAAVFGKNRHNVLRDIRNLECSGDFNAINFDLVEYMDAKGQPRPEYIMTRDGFTMVVMGFTGEKAARFKEAYIREFNRMEEKIRNDASRRIPGTFKEALLLAAKLEEEREALEAQNKQMAPKAEFYDAAARSATALDLGRVAKILNFTGIGRNNLFSFLRDAGVLMPDNIPYQEYVDRGYFKVIEQLCQTSDGKTRVSLRTMAYQTGIGFIRRKLVEAGYLPYERTRQLTLFAEDSEDWA
jgi:anti-repressor protein